MSTMPITSGLYHSTTAMPPSASAVVTAARRLGWLEQRSNLPLQANTQPLRSGFFVPKTSNTTTPKKTRQNHQTPPTRAAKRPRLDAFITTIYTKTAPLNPHFTQLGGVPTPPGKKPPSRPVSTGAGTGQAGRDPARWMAEGKGRDPARWMAATFGSSCAQKNQKKSQENEKIALILFFYNIK